MNPTWQTEDGRIQLYLGDCLTILPHIGKVDAVITDPPYEKEAHTLQRRLLGKSIGNGKRELIKEAVLGFDAITEEIRNGVAAEFSRLSSGWVLVFCQAEAISAWRDALQSAGAKFKRAMIWVKPDGMPQYNGQGPAQGYESIAAAWCGNGVSKWNGGGRHGVFTVNKGEGKGPNVHTTQKPIKLMTQLTTLFSNDEATVLDPFMGSGTTGVACIRTGRRFIGIEISSEYFEIAKNRIKVELQQQLLKL